MSNTVHAYPELVALEAKLTAANDLGALESVRVEALGKEGVFIKLVKDIATLPVEQRKDEGQKRNALKQQFAEALEQKKSELEKLALAARLEAERVDVTLPVREGASVGRVHPLSQTIEELVEIFAQWGFTLVDGPQIESDDYNFTRLNIPADHPARQMQDTFYMPDAPDGTKRVLRTQTSTIQVRTMLAQKPPIRILSVGRVYRNEHDMTHSAMFHQFEGLVIEETGKINMGHLKGVLLEFYRLYFGVPDLPIRFRPSFFPFTEPSAEMDIGCSRKGGELKIGNFGDWLEGGGCGMVHPRVLEMNGIDSNKYQGFAFGFGLERAAMLKYGIPDLRNFFDADIRWMKHYGFVPAEVPSLAQGSLGGGI